MKKEKMNREYEEELFVLITIIGVFVIIITIFISGITTIDYNSEDLRLCNNESVSWNEWFTGNYRSTPERVNNHLNCCEFVVRKMDNVWRRDRVCKAVEDIPK